jgi:hypothetical protein
MKKIFGLILGLALLSCSSTGLLESRLPQSIRDNCLVAAQKILGTDDYRQRLGWVEELSRSQNFDVLSGLSQAKTSNPMLWWRLKRRLKTLEVSGLTPAQVEDLVADLYRLTHRESHLKKWFRGGYQEVKKSYIIDSLSTRLLSEDLSKVFLDAGLLRGAGAVEKFRVTYRQHFRAVNLIVSAWANATSWVHGVPFAYFPPINTVDRIELPLWIREKALKEGLNSVYPDVERLFGRQADITTIWGEISAYGTYAAYTALLVWAGTQAYSDYQKAEENSLEALESKGEAETRSDRDQRIDQQISEWKKRFNSENGRAPSAEEVEDYTRVLRFYGGSGRTKSN